MAKNLPANVVAARDTGLIPELGRFPGGGNGNALQSSCLENPKERGDLWATVHGVPKSWTQMSIVKAAQSCLTLCDSMDYTVDGILQARMGSFSLLQGIVLTQGSNPGLPYCRRILYQLSHKGNPQLSIHTCIRQGAASPNLEELNLCNIVKVISISLLI